MTRAAWSGGLLLWVADIIPKGRAIISINIADIKASSTVIGKLEVNRTQVGVPEPIPGIWLYPQLPFKTFSSQVKYCA